MAPPRRPSYHPPRAGTIQIIKSPENRGNLKRRVAAVHLGHRDRQVQLPGGGVQCGGFDRQGRESRHPRWRGRACRNGTRCSRGAIIQFTLSAEHAVRVAVDYLGHHTGASGPRGPKVFKLTTRTIEPGRPLVVTRGHQFREISVRRLYPGTHRIDIQATDASSALPTSS